jgi:hypothetical protein
MTAGSEQPYSPLQPPRQVEGVTPLSQRVAWNAEKEKKQHRRKRKPKPPIDEQMSDAMENNKNTAADGHIDFRA